MSHCIRGPRARLAAIFLALLSLVALSACESTAIKTAAFTASEPNSRGGVTYYLPMRYAKLKARGFADDSVNYKAGQADLIKYEQDVVARKTEVAAAGGAVAKTALAEQQVKLVQQMQALIEAQRSLDAAKKGEKPASDATTDEADETES